ncbi:hypothetical protein DFH09DRAFT_1110505 [Mycena vulgaris]|nr:hypothetical protein DFH09DRAFT_1110505 [Mycena vulgaris]
MFGAHQECCGDKAFDLNKDKHIATSLARIKVESGTRQGAGVGTGAPRMQQLAGNTKWDISITCFSSFYIQYSECKLQATVREDNSTRCRRRAGSCPFISSHGASPPMSGWRPRGTPITWIHGPTHLPELRIRVPQRNHIEERAAPGPGMQVLGRNTHSITPPPHHCSSYTSGSCMRACVVLADALGNFEPEYGRETGGCWGARSEIQGVGVSGVARQWVISGPVW